MDFKEQVMPFYWVEYDNGASFCLEQLEYKAEVFQTREKDGFSGSGYDWVSLARVFIEEKSPDLKPSINFDPEADLFCAYSEDKQALEKFAIAFKNACEDDVLINDLFSRAELD